jgi:hypothetical protein
MPSKRNHSAVERVLLALRAIRRRRDERFGAFTAFGPRLGAPEFEERACVRCRPERGYSLAKNTYWPASTILAGVHRSIARHTNIEERQS